MIDSFGVLLAVSLVAVSAASFVNGLSIGIKIGKGEK